MWSFSMMEKIRGPLDVPGVPPAPGPGHMKDYYRPFSRNGYSAMTGIREEIRGQLQVLDGFSRVRFILLFNDSGRIIPWENLHMISRQYIGHKCPYFLCACSIDRISWTMTRFSSVSIS